MPTTTTTSSITLDQIRDRATLTTSEGTQVFNVDMDTLLAAIRRGEIPAIRIGRVWRIPVPAVLRMLDGESA